MNFTDQTLLTPAGGLPLRDTTQVVTGPASLDGAMSTNVFVDNQLDAALTLHLDYSLDGSTGSWRELDTGTALTVAAGAAKALIGNVVLQMLAGRVRVRYTAGTTPTAGVVVVAVQTHRIT